MGVARSVRDLVSDRRLDAELWCDGRSPWIRAALLGYLLYAGVRHLLDPLYRSWFAGITLAFHELGHLLRYAGLALHHRDPFDRLLVAQAQALRAPIVTADSSFARYEVETLW